LPLRSCPLRGTIPAKQRRVRFLEASSPDIREPLPRRIADARPLLEPGDLRPQRVGSSCTPKRCASAGGGTAASVFLRWLHIRPGALVQEHWPSIEAVARALDGGMQGGRSHRPGDGHGLSPDTPAEPGPTCRPRIHTLRKAVQVLGSRALRATRTAPGWRRRRSRSRSPAARADHAASEMIDYAGRVGLREGSLP